jgi:hypothetical protein
VRRYAFVFVCQGGDLEIKALLLAASLRRFLHCEYELVACIPKPEESWGVPSASTLSALKRLGVRTADIVNPLGRDYPHANKIACLGVPVDAGKRIFLDSDIQLVRPFHDEARFGVPINLKPADYRRISDETVWRKAYEAAGIAMPTARVRSTVSGEEGLPYFQGGFIAVRSDVDLAGGWLECARKIDGVDGIPRWPGDERQDKWSDMTSLAVAVQKLGVEYDCLDEQYNYPAHVRPLDRRALPYFCHYHWPEVIAREPVLTALFDDAATAHPEIEALAASQEKWAPLVRRNRRAVAVPPRASSKALIILGMHRSGTSALAGTCRLLGVDLGSRFLPQGEDNPLGHWEPLDVVTTHDLLLRALGSSWDDVRPLPAGWMDTDAAHSARDGIRAFIEGTFTDVSLWAVKDPRLCRLLPLWLDVLSDLSCRPRFLMIVRNPAEVAASLEIRSGVPAERAHLLWLRHVVEMEWWSRPYERVLLSYDALVHDWRRTMERALTVLGVDLDVRQAPDDGFVYRELRHHALDCCTESPRRDSPMWEEVRSTYRALQPMVGTDLRQAGALFDALSVRLRAADQYCDEVLAERDARMRELQELLDAQAAESAALRQRMSEQESGIRVLHETLNARDEQMRAMRMELAARSEQAGTLKDRIVDAEARIDALYASRSWRITRPLRAIRDVFRRL